MLRRLRHFAPILLAAIFWIAQVQGTAHGISHLADPAGASGHVTLPHNVLCGECVAFAQAGAAPIVALAAADAPLQLERLVATASPAVRAAPPAHAYLSRGPPRSPI